MTRKAVKVSDLVDDVMAEAYRRMRDAGLSHLEASEFLQSWGTIETPADLEKAVDDLCQKAEASG